MLVTSNRDVISAFKASRLFLAITLEFFAISTKKNARIMLLKILTHSMAGSETFCFDGCFVKWAQHVSAVIILFKKTYQ